MVRKLYFGQYLPILELLEWMEGRERVEVQKLHGILWVLWEQQELWERLELGEVLPNICHVKALLHHPCGFLRKLVTQDILRLILSQSVVI